MGLITMGYGHLTIVTMGLGNSIRIARQEVRYQVGEVEFQDLTPTVRLTDKIIKESFEEKEREAHFKDIEREEVMRDGS